MSGRNYGKKVLYLAIAVSLVISGAQVKEAFVAILTVAFITFVVLGLAILVESAIKRHLEKRKP